MRRMAVVGAISLLGISWAAGAANQVESGTRPERRRVETQELIKGEGYVVHVIRQDVRVRPSNLAGGTNVAFDLPGASPALVVRVDLKTGEMKVLGTPAATAEELETAVAGKATPRWAKYSQIMVDAVTDERHVFVLETICRLDKNGVWYGDGMVRMSAVDPAGGKTLGSVVLERNAPLLSVGNKGLEWSPPGLSVEGKEIVAMGKHFRFEGGTFEVVVKEK